MDDEIITGPMIRIGNQVVAGPKQSKNQVHFNNQPQRRSRFDAKESGRGGKRGRSVSVLKVKDPKLELDLLSSLLDEVENAEKQVEMDIEKNDQQDFE